MKYLAKTFSFTLLFIILLLSGCMKNELTIRFDFPKNFVGNYIVDYYAWNSERGTWIEAVAPVQNGAASLTCAASRPTLIYIRDASSPNASIAIYAERGDEIVIAGDNPDMYTWTVTGNKVSERWSAWRRQNAAVLGASAEGFPDKRKKVISDFVKANKDDKLAVLVMLTEWNRREDADGFLRLWNMIGKDAKSARLLELCGSTDMLGVQFLVEADGSLSPAREKAMKSAVFRTRANGVDTLKFGKASASLLYFYEDDDTSRGEAMDSIKKLVKQYPDSLTRIMSDVCVRPDSMVWINSLRSDTVATLVRSWAPRGIADPTFVALGASRIPWFVVLAKDGRSRYSGAELKDAVAAFRKEMDAASAHK